MEQAAAGWCCRATRCCSRQLVDCTRILNIKYRYSQSAASPVHTTNRQGFPRCRNFKQHADIEIPSSIMTSVGTQGGAAEPRSLPRG